MKRSEPESKYLKNRTIDNKTEFKKQKNFFRKLYKEERKKFYSDPDLKKVTDNKQFWKTIKPLLSDECLQSSTISLVDNKM